MTARIQPSTSVSGGCLRSEEATDRIEYGFDYSAEAEVQDIAAREQHEQDGDYGDGSTAWPVPGRLRCRVITKCWCIPYYATSSDTVYPVGEQVVENEADQQVVE